MLWPKTGEGTAKHVDHARVHWLDHPRLRATQVNVTPDQSTILATYIGPETAGD